MKKEYTSKFKAQTVLRLLKGNTTEKELEAEYNIPPRILAEWKKQFREGAADVFRYVIYDEDCERKVNDKYMIRIRELRQHNGYSQKEIGEFLGTAQNMYARYENGRSQMPIRYLVKLAIFYGVSLDYISGMTNEGEDDDAEG